MACYEVKNRNWKLSGAQEYLHWPRVITESKTKYASALNPTAQQRNSKPDSPTKSSFACIGRTSFFFGLEPKTVVASQSIITVKESNNPPGVVMLPRVIYKTM